MPKTSKKTSVQLKKQKFTFTETEGDSIIIEASSLSEARRLFVMKGKESIKPQKEDVETSENIDE